MLRPFSVSVLLLSGFAFACGGHDSGSGTSERAPEFFPNYVIDPGVASENPCDPPDVGCPCEEPGEETDCGTIHRYSEDYVTCSFGIRTCGENMEWGECIGDEVSVLPIPETGAP